MSGLIRDIDALIPECADACRSMLFALSEINLPVMVNETKRLKSVQAAYYAQGRWELSQVNEKRKLAGLWEITEAENAKKITWTLESKHIDGKAFDVVPLKDGKPWWNAPAEVWQKIVAAGKNAGLVWGGDWKGKEDFPHFELP